MTKEEKQKERIVPNFKSAGFGLWKGGYKEKQIPFDTEKTFPQSEDARQTLVLNV